jgi:O-antigen ligase
VSVDIVSNTVVGGDTPYTYRASANPAFWWLCALSSLPLLTAMASLELDGVFAGWQVITRRFWLVPQLFEIATIIFALSQGCSPSAQIKALNLPVRLLVLLWVINLAIATAMAAQPQTAVLSAISWMIHGLFALSLWHLFKGWAANSANRIAATLPLGSAAFGLLIIGFVSLVGVGSDYNWILSLPGFPHIRHSGYFLMPALALATWMIFSSSGRTKYAYAVLLAMNFGFAIWIGSRGPLIVYAALLIPALLVFARVYPRAKFGSGASVTAALLAGILMSQTIPAPAHTSFNALSRFLRADNSVDSFSSGRTELWRDGLKAISQQPFLGHGGNQFRYQVPSAQKTYNHPHNSILQFTYEWGLIGALAMFSLIALGVAAMVRATMRDPERNLGLFFAGSSILLFSLIDGLLYYNLPIMLFLVCLAGIVVQGQSRHQN